MGLRIAAALLAVVVVPAQEPEFKDLSALMASLPAAKVVPLDPPSALLFSALPLACVDDLQPRPGATRPYFWQPTYRTIDDYARTRAFWGCNDWPTAVGATWTMVSLLKKYPELPSGELAYFKAAGNAQRPYGYAWFLKLYAELATWKDPDGTRYAENATPLARFFADGLIGFLIDLERPNRTAGQANSALMLSLLLDYVDATRDQTIRRAVTETARRLYLTDKNCATASEASSPEMVSPCLTEAALMSRVLEPAAYVTWLDAFLPAAHSANFKPLRSISFDATGPARGRGGRGDRSSAPTPTATPAPAATATGRGATPTPTPSAVVAMNARANWIGLAFTRAGAFARVAAALPPTDARVEVFQRLSEIHADMGHRELTHPAAFEAPWVGAFAVSYLLSMPTGGTR
jgi:hypothetical protein